LWRKVRRIMIRHIWSDRRQEDRRSDASVLGGQRKKHRRRPERRGFIRLVYPQTAAPKVLNADFSVADISQTGIRLICRGDCLECTHPHTFKSIAGLRIQFHDGETIDVDVRILRCARTLNLQYKTYAGFVEHGISAKRIAKEQAYLLSHFPDFCRDSREQQYSS